MADAARAYSTTLPDLNLDGAEKRLCMKALDVSGSIVEAAKLLGVTRHALKRRIIKHRISWPAEALPTTSA